MAQSIWTYLRENPQWLSLINNENLHEGRYLERSSKLGKTLSPVIDLVRVTIERGVAAGEFRHGIDPLDFYVTLVGMGYYIVSNRFTLQAFTGRNYGEHHRHASISNLHVDMLLAYLRRASHTVD
ncbi:TetR family transcriptional regulator [Caballeronia arvi]|uniref:TetR family transcriptional regulator n=1 Tax=Caballeronia arvi TaxID=1777135 RepID=A0A158KQN4_9BURK|nr:TetR family transcriptional regulator [Caballeronia arvi]